MVIFWSVASFIAGIVAGYLIGLNRNRLTAKAEIEQLRADVKKAKDDLIAAVKRATKS